jgi:hypothetical protein
MLKLENYTSPYLIQRGTILENSGALSDAVRLDYMGRAEFEFGAMPGSLRRMETQQDKLASYVFKDVQSKGQPLRMQAYSVRKILIS